MRIQPRHDPGRLAVFIKIFDIADHDVRAPRHNFRHFRVILGISPVVAVEEGNPFALSLANREIAGVRQPAVGFIQLRETIRKPAHIVLNNLRGGIGRTIVDHQHLQVFIGLAG